MFKKNYDKDFEKAKEIYNQDPKKGKVLIEKLCKKGYSPATLFMRERLLEGMALLTSEAEKQHFLNAANNLLYIAANDGDADSQYKVGYMLEKGIWFQMNPQKSVDYYMKAAKSGHLKAMTRLGVCYFNGVGVASNPEEALRWYQKAANEGDTFAMVNIAIRYETGKGGHIIDKNMAYEMYHRALDTAQEYINVGGYGVKWYHEPDERNVIKMAREGLDRLHPQN